MPTLVCHGWDHPVPGARVPVWAGVVVGAGLLDGAIGGCGGADSTAGAGEGRRPGKVKTCGKNHHSASPIKTSAESIASSQPVDGGTRPWATRLSRSSAGNASLGDWLKASQSL